MTLSRAIVIVMAVALLVVGLTALAALCRLVFPRLVARSRDNVERMPVRAFLVGLINFTFFGLIATALSSGGEGGGLLALLVLTVLLSFVAIGMAAVALLLGERLRPDDSQLRQTIAGALALELAAIVPIVGWFAVPTLALLTGYGALIIALVRRRERREPASDEVTR